MNSQRLDHPFDKFKMTHYQKYQKRSTFFIASAHAIIAAMYGVCLAIMIVLQANAAGDWSVLMTVPRGEMNFRG